MSDDRPGGPELRGFARLLCEVDEALRRDPRELGLVRRRADLLRLMGDDAGALSCLDALLALSPRDAQALRIKADLLEAAGDDAGALAALDALPDDDPDTALRRAGLSLRLGDRQGFYRRLEKAVASHPGDVALKGVRTAALAVQPWEAGLGDLEGLADELSEGARSCGGRGELDALLERCRAWDPRGQGLDGDFDPWTEAVRLLRLEGRGEEAREALHEGLDFCDAVLGRHPGAVAVLRLRGRLLLELGWAADAVRAFEEAQRLDPCDGRARQGRERAARLLMGEGERREGRKEGAARDS